MPGLHFVAHLFHVEMPWDFRSAGFDSCVVVNVFKGFTVPFRDLILDAWDAWGTSDCRKRQCVTSSGGDTDRCVGKFGGHVRLYRDVDFPSCSTVAANNLMYILAWHQTGTIRRGLKLAGYVLHESTPELFRAHLRDALNLVESRDPEERLVFVKSWNEWGEGNYLEPDQQFGHDYLKVIERGTPASGNAVRGRSQRNVYALLIREIRCRHRIDLHERRA